MALQVINPGAGAGAQLRQMGTQAAPAPSGLPSLPRVNTALGPTLQVQDITGKEREKFINALGVYAANQQKMRDNEDLVSALTDLQKSAVDFQTEWKLSHFGVDARDAGSVFSKQVDDMAKDMLEKRFKGRPELASTFRERAAQISLSGFTHGSSYDSQQDLQYRKDQLDGQMATLQGIIATGTPADIDAAAQTYRDSLEVFFPGADHTKSLAALDKNVYMGMIQRHMSQDNPSGAMAYLNAGLQKKVFGPGDVERVRSMIEGNVYQQAQAMRDAGDVEGINALRAQYGGFMGGGAGGGNVPAGLNEGLAAQTAQFGGGRTRYGFGSRNPNSGSVDCSGWVGHALESCGVKGFKGLTADKQVEKAQRIGRDVPAEELFSNPKEGLVIGLDQGQRSYDKGRKNGIDHVVVTYRDPSSGEIMVSESSSSKGVHGQTLSSWLAYHQSKGHKFFAGDISGQQISLNPGRQEPHDLSKAPGLLEQGNIDPYKRKVERRADGSIATVESFSFEEDGKEVLIPRVIDGKTVSVEEAIEHYHKTGEFLGKFDTPEHASDYAQKFHENQAVIYGDQQPGVPRSTFDLRMDAYAKAAQEKRDNITAQAAADDIIKQISAYPTAELREAYAVEMVRRLPENMQKKAEGKINTWLADQKKLDKAETVKQVQTFQEYARSKNLTATQAMAEIEAATKISDEAKEKLRKDYNGRLGKETPENRLALGELKRLIDTGGSQEGGIDKDDTEAIEAWAFDHGLTSAQTKNALKYAETGGNAGSLTMTMVNNAAKMLFPTDQKKAKRVAADYFDLVEGQLEKGKKADVQQVKKILSLLLLPGEQSERAGFGIGRDTTYAEELRRGQTDTFFADVPEDARQRISDMLKREGVKVTPKRISDIYIEEMRKR